MMRIQNFQFEENYAISRDDDWLDLHNDYDFQAYRYDSTMNNFTFTWNRASEHSAKATCSQISLRFENVMFLKVAFQASPETICDSKTLAFVGFLHQDDLNVMDGCLLQEEADSTYHVILRFNSGLAIKCFAESIACDLVR